MPVNVTCAGVDIELQWFDKSITRLTEALSLSFKVKPRAGFKWWMSKMDQFIDPNNVVFQGSQNQHGMHCVCVSFCYNVILIINKWYERLTSLFATELGQNEIFHRIAPYSTLHRTLYCTIPYIALYPISDRTLSCTTPYIARYPLLNPILYCTVP